MKVGIIGFGNMGRAIASGLRKREPEVELFVYDKAKELAASAGGSHGARRCQSAAELCRSSELVIVAVKPQDTEELFRDLGGAASKSKVLSIVAGRSISYFKLGLGTEEVIRCMPNLAATVGSALIGVAVPPGVGPAFREAALKVLRSIGTPLELPEESMAAITGISGSGIAFALSFLHAMALGGTKAGLTYESALAAALSVLKGACTLAEATAEHPIALLSKVTSPAGTTIAGLSLLEERAFTSSVIEAVNAAATRARELER